MIYLKLFCNADVTEDSSVVLFVESHEFFFFFFFFPSFSCGLLRPCCNHGLHDLDKWLPPGIRMILVSLQNEFHLLTLAWENEEECYLLEVGLDESEVCFWDVGCVEATGKAY